MRTATSLAAIGPVLLLLSGAVVLADAFADAKKNFTACQKPDRSGADREAAARDIAAFDRKDAAKLLVSGLEFSQETLDSLVAERQAVLNGSLGHRDPKAELMALKDAVDAEFLVLEAIEKGLAKMREFKTIDYIQREALLRSKNWKVKQVAARALGVIGEPGSVPHLVKALKDKDARVRSAAALSLGELKDATTVESLVKLLGDRAWTVRACTIDALGKIGAKECVGPLIAQMRKESGRLREDCVEALVLLTGQSFGDAPDAWEAWWEENRAKYEGPPPAPEKEDEEEEPSPEDEDYYGIPITTRKAIFILDISESMSYSAVQWQDKPKPGEISRLELAKREFIRALTPFNSESRFNVVVFNDIITTWKKGMVAGSAKNKEQATKWVKALRPTSTTNIYGALEEAFRIAGMGADDKHYDLGADTIFLMSDGAPTNVDLSDDDPLRILRAVRKWNRLGRVRVHTIGLKGHNVGFMSQLALENAGRYVSR